MIESNNSGTASSSPRQRLSASMSAEASSSSSSSSEIKFQNSSSIQMNSMASPSNVNMGFSERALSAVGAAFLSAIIVNPLDVAKNNSPFPNGGDLMADLEEALVKHRSNHITGSENGRNKGKMDREPHIKSFDTI